VIKRFSYRLDQVLRHRASVAEMRERALAEVAAQLMRERRALEDLEGMRVEVLDELAGFQAKGFESLERELYQLYLNWLGAEIVRQGELIAGLEELRETKRIELVKASQDLKIVERLKEREYGEYMKTVARAEQTALDEVAGNAFVRGVRVLGAPERGAAERGAATEDGGRS
jgi:flagellar FliJ protein